MNRKMRIIGLITLLFFVTGCSGYRTVGSRENWPNLGDQCQNLQPGDLVKITPRSGSQVKGNVQTVSPDTLTLLVVNPNGWNDRKYVWYDKEKDEGKEMGFAFQDLKEVEVREDDPANTALLLGGVLIVVGGYVAATIAVSNSFNLNNSSKSMGPILSR